MLSEGQLVVIRLFHCGGFNCGRFLSGNLVEPIFYKDFETYENFKAFEIYLSQCEHETHGDSANGVSNWNFQCGDCNFYGVADVRYFSNHP